MYEKYTKKRFWYCLKIFQSSETLLGALRAQIVVKTCFFLQKKLKSGFALDVGRKTKKKNEGENFLRENARQAQLNL